MRKLPVVLVATLLLAGCGSGTSGSGSGAANKGAVKVLYAGSLANLMEHDLGPKSQQATGVQFEGTAAGSTQLVNEIKGRLTAADVFISASADANNGLLGTANGGWESWYATFASAPLVLGYNPNSKFAADLHTKPWSQVVTESGFRLGSTDPALDPKGKLAAQAMTQAGIKAGTAAVFPEEQLVGRLQSGQLDAGFFYSSEAAEAHIPTITLGSIQLQATYTVSVLNHAPNATAAISFVRYLLGSSGEDLLRAHGLRLQTVTVTGDAAAVPAELRGDLGLK